MATDAELVAAALAGDKAAFGTLSVRHRRLAERVCARFLGDSDLAADIVQEALLGPPRRRRPAAGSAGGRLPLPADLGRAGGGYRAGARPRERGFGPPAHEVDARPSDAINLAVNTGAPIRVDAGLFDEADRPDWRDYDIAGAAIAAEVQAVVEEERRRLSGEGQL